MIQVYKLYRTKKISNVPKAFSANLKLYHMCGYVGLRDEIRGRGGANGLWVKGQLIFCMGLEWDGRTLALKGTTPIRDFMHLKVLHCAQCCTFFSIV